ncbi:DUF4388 domain-containing protein [Actinospongicola halichondriae]|uniref:DUF4388 domain-containing protein n=1 Tax=Actinospongicola halichondriae TaxID=3236844 RepID=UPI003D3E461F
MISWSAWSSVSSEISFQKSGVGADSGGEANQTAPGGATVALQGTLETFSVPEVLRLLSNTGKTGLLALDGDRGSGKVWMGAGSIIGARSDHESTGDIDATLFDLLRFTSGDFVFETDTRPEEAADPVDVDAALERAETLLQEWREIETVVPSMLLGVRLAREIQSDSVTVSADQWRSLVAVGAGTSVAGLGQRLELGELDTCRRVRDLVEDSLIELTDELPADEVAAPGATADAASGGSADDDRDDGYSSYNGYDEPKLVDHDLSQDEVASLSSNLAGFVARSSEPDIESDVESVTETVFDDEIAGQDDEAEPEEIDRAREIAEEFDNEQAATNGDEVESADDFLAQLTNLSPKAAAAIEATAEEAAERAEDAPRPAAAPDGDEEINRNLLLKFLSSTKN